MKKNQKKLTEERFPYKMALMVLAVIKHFKAVSRCW